MNDPLRASRGRSLQLTNIKSTLPLIDGLPSHHFGAILVDPPWAFKSYAPCANPKYSRGVERHYPTMTLAAIRNLPIRELAAKEGCHLFLWATGPNLRHAFDMIDAWGFRYSGTAFVWVKLKKSFNANQLRVLPTAACDLHTGLGFTTRKNTEICLLARRGNARRVAKDVLEVILSPRREHSRKPEETRERVERYAVGPYLELFGREHRNGWVVRGDQLGKFDDTI